MNTQYNWYWRIRNPHLMHEVTVHDVKSVWQTVIVRMIIGLVIYAKTKYLMNTLYNVDTTTIFRQIRDKENIIEQSFRISSYTVSPVAHVTKLHSLCYCSLSIMTGYVQSHVAHNCAPQHNAKTSFMFYKVLQDFSAKDNIKFL
jgi:hypothetical protein